MNESNKPLPPESDVSPESVLRRWQASDEEMRAALCELPPATIPEDLTKLIQLTSVRASMLARTIRNTQRGEASGSDGGNRKKKQ
jgi:hypothetical protein